MTSFFDQVYRYRLRYNPRVKDLSIYNKETARSDSFIIVSVTKVASSKINRLTKHYIKGKTIFKQMSMNVTATFFC